MTTNLNSVLIVQQNCSKEDIKNILYWHDIRESVFSNMQKIVDVDPSCKNTMDIMRGFVQLVEEIEYQLQYYWHFPLDRNKHSWWYQSPGCTCPTFENRIRYATGERITSNKCVLHGDNDENW